MKKFLLAILVMATFSGCCNLMHNPPKWWPETFTYYVDVFGGERSMGDYLIGYQYLDSCPYDENIPIGFRFVCDERRSVWVFVANPCDGEVSSFIYHWGPTDDYRLRIYRDSIYEDEDVNAMLKMIFSRGDIISQGISGDYDEEGTLNMLCEFSASDLENSSLVKK